MGKIENIEKHVQALSPEELATFVIGSSGLFGNLQLERDAQARKLDPLAEKALRDHASGKTTRRSITTQPPISGVL